MQDHQHIEHSNAGGGPQPAGNESTRVTTCPQHGTMRTGGTCGQCQPTGNARTRALGRETTGQQTTAHTGTGMPTGSIPHEHADIPAVLPSQARTPKSQASAREYDRAAKTLIREPKQLEEPGLTPGAPHPDPALAAKGWHVCSHGIYTRH